MEKYKKTEIVEALQWKLDNLKEVNSFLKLADEKNVRSYSEFETAVKNSGLKIMVDGSLVRVVEKDYIVKDKEGKVYTNKQDIFEKEYEAVKEAGKK